MNARQYCRLEKRHLESHPEKKRKITETDGENDEEKKRTDKKLKSEEKVEEVKMEDDSEKGMKEIPKKKPRAFDKFLERERKEREKSKRIKAGEFLKFSGLRYSSWDDKRVKK